MKKKLLLIITSGLITTACVESSHSAGNNNNPEELKKHFPDETKAKAKVLDDLFSLADAEKILGEPGSLSDSSTKTEINVVRYLCGYKANAEDDKTKRTGTVYFFAEQYNDTLAAKNKYSFIKKANEHNGIKVVEHLGDEAYFHSDGENFYFIMVRKGKKVFNMKVNKITSKTSLNDFNLVAKKITDEL